MRSEGGWGIREWILVFGLAVWSAAPAAGKDSSRALDLARQLNEAFVGVAEKVSPAVVVIDIAQREEKADAADADHPWFDLLPEEWKERLRKDRESSPRGGDEFNGQGSGMVLSKEGFILTNNHVVEDARKLRVRLRDGRQFEAEVRGADPESDLAVIQIKDPPKDLPKIQFGDSDQVRVGEFAIAIGAPFRLDYTITFGHISAKSRSEIIGGMLDQNFLQTDANINPGNSGGPLVNIEGEVIGINSMIRGLNSGIGFAIPSNLAREISGRLIKDGRVTRAWLGIGIGALRDDEDMQALVPGLADGVVVTAVIPDGPASKATPELRRRDVITAVDGRKVATPTELTSLVTRKVPGSTVVLDVRRLEESLKVRVSPEARPDRAALYARRSSRPRVQPSENHGLVVVSLTAEAAKLRGVDAGVLVERIEPDSLAAQFDLQVGDVITEVNQRPVSSPAEFLAALKEASPAEGIRLNVVRDGQGSGRVLKQKS